AISPLTEKHMATTTNTVIWRWRFASTTSKRRQTSSSRTTDSFWKSSHLPMKSRYMKTAHGAVSMAWNDGGTTAGAIPAGSPTIIRDGGSLCVNPLTGYATNWNASL